MKNSDYIMLAKARADSACAGMDAISEALTLKDADGVRKLKERIHLIVAEMMEFVSMIGVDGNDHDR